MQFLFTHIDEIRKVTDEMYRTCLYPVEIDYQKGKTLFKLCYHLVQHD